VVGNVLGSRKKSSLKEMRTSPSIFAGQNLKIKVADHNFQKSVYDNFSGHNNMES